MAAYPDPRTVTASEVLAGLRGIVEREQLDHAGYVSGDIDHELAESGALCRGHRACAVGATWLAAGVKPQRDRAYVPYFTMPGANGSHGDRLDWLSVKGYGGLLRAYVALCAAARDYMDARGLRVIGWEDAGPLEGLFESESEGATEDESGFLIEPRDMLVVIDRAEELIA